MIDTPQPATTRMAIVYWTETPLVTRRLRAWRLLPLLYLLLAVYNWVLLWGVDVEWFLRLLHGGEVVLFAWFFKRMVDRVLSTRGLGFTPMPFPLSDPGGLPTGRMLSHLEGLYDQWLADQQEEDPHD